jgi:hypothetical protein
LKSIESRSFIRNSPRSSGTSAVALWGLQRASTLATVADGLRLRRDTRLRLGICRTCRARGDLRVPKGLHHADRVDETRLRLVGVDLDEMPSKPGDVIQHPLFHAVGHARWSIACRGSPRRRGLRDRHESSGSASSSCSRVWRTRRSGQSRKSTCRRKTGIPQKYDKCKRQIFVKYAAKPCHSPMRVRTPRMRSA